VLPRGVGAMIFFGNGTSAAPTATLAAHEAATLAVAMLGRQSPQVPTLAIVFASASYDDVESAARAVRAVVGDAQIIGGTSGGCVFDGAEVARRGVSVVLLGGDGLEVEAHTAQRGSPSCVEAVPAAEKVARAAAVAAERSFDHFACLVFAPGIGVDGEALVAAVRKGAGAHAQLAGALTGDDFTFDRPKVFFGDELRDDCVVLTGLFTKTALGISARHGWAAVGPRRTVTRAEGIHLLELDDRPALDVWLEDAREGGATIPEGRNDIALYLANNYPLGIADESMGRIRVPDDKQELVARAPFSVREDGAITLSASIPDGSRVCVLHASHADLLRASGEAAASALEGAGSRVAGALVLACTGRLAVLGDAFSKETAEIRLRVAGPIGGACVFGEIARNLRDRDAFFNTTAVVVAFPA
jgi:hypothetical protein